MASFSFERHPGRTVHLMHFTDVANSVELVEKIRSGKLEPPLALFNADLVVSAFAVLAAAHKALQAEAAGKLRTHTLHAELVVNYSASKHIREALLQWGVSAGSTHVLAARFDASPAELAEVRRLVQGTEVDLPLLPSLAKTDRVLKLYKISPPELEVGSLEDAVVARIAGREFGAS